MVTVEAAGPLSGDRWFGIGRSWHPDAREAGLRAVAEAVAGRDAALLIIFASAAYDPVALLEGACSAAPDDAVVVGGTTMGELASGGQRGLAEAQDGGDASGVLGDASRVTRPSVVIAALGGPGFIVRSKVVANASAHPREAGMTAASVMDGIGSKHKVMLMILDGLTRERPKLVWGAYSVLGASVPMVGGCTADNLSYTKTGQFHGTGRGAELFGDSVVLVGLGSTEPFGVGIDHGWQKHGDAMVVTRSSDGEIFTIDNEPALDVYLRCIGTERTLLQDKAKFRELAFDRPLGLSRGTAEDIRVLYKADPRRGSVSCLADVPQGALVWTMKTATPSLIEAATCSTRSAIEGLGGRLPLGMLIFDCGARKVKLGVENVIAEQEAFRKAVDVPFGGFYTYGEIARAKGSRGAHHLTVVSLAIA